MPPAIRRLIERTHDLDAEIDELDREIRRIVREDEALGRLMTIPGVGELTAMAVYAFAPPMESFRNGRDFAAWVGITPRESSTGGRQRLGEITKMGQRDIRRLLYLGATAVISSAIRRREVTDPWLGRMLDEKPRKVVAVALLSGLRDAAAAKRLFRKALTGRSHPQPRVINTDQPRLYGSAISAVKTEGILQRCCRARLRPSLRLRILPLIWRSGFRSIAADRCPTSPGRHP